MPVSILPVTMRPGHAPKDLQFFSFFKLVVYSTPPGTKKETITYARAPDRPHIRFMGTSFLKQC